MRWLWRQVRRLLLVALVVALGLASFGLGTVVALDGQGDNAVASVDFGSQGVKRLLLRYAPVEKL